MRENDDMAKLTQEVKDTALEQGATLVGVASIDRFEPGPPFFDRAPRGHHPRDYISNAHSVISVAQPILNPVMDAPACLAEQDLEMIPPDVRYNYFEMLYDGPGHRILDYMLEFVCQAIGQLLLSRGYQAMVFPTTSLTSITGEKPHAEGMTSIESWEGPSEHWARRYSPFRYPIGPFSHRHAATRAGLGEFGLNNVVLTREYGPRQRFNSVITDAKLEADALISDPICFRDTCGLCIKACIAEAIILRDDKQKKDYRSVESVDMDEIFIDTPSKTEAPRCKRRRERIPQSPIRGDCVRICPVNPGPVELTDRLKKLKAGTENLEGF